MAFVGDARHQWAYIAANETCHTYEHFILYELLLENVVASAMTICTKIQTGVLGHPFCVVVFSYPYFSQLRKFALYGIAKDTSTVHINAFPLV